MPDSGVFRRAALAALAATLLLASRAEAQPSAIEQARQDFFKGVEAQDHGRYADALELYVRVRGTTSSPALLFNIGTCQERLGRLVAAADAFRDAQSAARERADAEVEREATARLAALAESTPRLTVRLAEADDGAVAELDGRIVEIERFVDLPIDPGGHRLLVRHAASSRVFDLAFEAPERSVRVVDVDLEHPPPPAEAPAPAQEIAPQRHTYVPAIVAGAATVAFGAAAIVTGVVGHDKRSQYDELNTHPTPDNREDRESLRSSGQTLFVANAVLLGATALASAGAIYFLVRPPLAAKAATLGVGPTAASLRIRF